MSYSRGIRRAGWVAVAVPCLLLLGCDSSGATVGVAQPLTSTDGSTGVAACDSYLDQYERCAQTVLTSQQFNQHVKGIREQRTTWATMADTQPKKDALALVCRRAIVTARAEFPTCTFAGG